jgi:hypothetical protein
VNKFYPGGAQPPASPGIVKKWQRNLAIVAAYEAGEKLDVIGSRFGISGVQASAIARAHGCPARQYQPKSGGGVVQNCSSILAEIVLEDRGYSSPCWIWQKRINFKGYGIVSHGDRSHGVHRVAYELFVGPIPEGLQLDHLCCVKACCNPVHLEPVTNAENARRSRGVRRWEFCKRGHRMDDDNRFINERNGIVLSSGCIICRDERRHKRARTKAVAEIVPEHEARV